MAKEPIYGVKSVGHYVTVKVKIKSEFWFRLWVARQLIRLAAWVIQANVEFVNPEGGDGG